MKEKGKRSGGGKRKGKMITQGRKEGRDEWMMEGMRENGGKKRDTKR